MYFMLHENSVYRQEVKEGLFDLLDVMSLQVLFLQAVYHSLQKALFYTGRCTFLRFYTF